jgi:hypothetical protein
MTIANKSYSPPIPSYPKINLFTTSTINDTVTGFTPITVNFTYLKRNPTDFISFSNMYDVLNDTVSYRVAPLYEAYGYNTSDAPLYTTTRSGTFPIGFSTVGGPIGPYTEGLSSYVLLVSTIYTAGCNTIFPVSTSGGFTSFSFYESTTNRTARGYSQNLSNGIVANITSTFSASNSFGYTFNDIIPSTPYTFQLVYGRQNPNQTLVISSLLYSEKAYDRAYAVYFSSMLYGSTVSSFNGNFINVNANTITVSSLFVSSINNGVSLGGSGNTTSTVSSFVTYVNQLASTLSFNMSSFSPVGGGGGSANTTSTVSSFVTYVNQLASTLSFNMSSFSPVGGGGGSANTTSTVSSLVTYVNQLASTLSFNMSTFNPVAGGGGGSANTTSTVSSFVTYITELASTLSFNMSSFSTTNTGQEFRTSTLYTSSIITAGLKQPFIQYGLSGSIDTPVSGSPYSSRGAGYSYLRITLPYSYANPEYSIQVTYYGAVQTVPLQVYTISANIFDIVAPTGTSGAYWTTFGNLF